MPDRPDAPAGPVEFRAEDSYVAAGRTVLTGPAPFEMPRTGSPLLGAIVRSGGRSYRVLGIERHTLPDRRPIAAGETIGLVVEPAGPTA